MPAPVAAGVFGLGVLLGELLVKAVGWVAKFFTRKIAVVAGVAIVLLGMFITCEAALWAIASGLSIVVPPQLQTAVNIFMPSNFDECLSAIISAKVIRFAYDWYLYLVELDKHAAMM